MCRRPEDQLKRWNDVAKLIGRAWRNQQRFKDALTEQQAQAHAAEAACSLLSASSEDTDALEACEPICDASLA